MSSAYLRLLIFLPAILIPACASSSPAFLMMYSAYKLNKQGDNIQPWSTPFPIWNQSIVPHSVLTVASWPAYRFLKRHVRWSGIPISNSNSSDPMDCILPGSSVNRISRQEYWSGLPFPSPGHLPDPEIEPMSPSLVDSLPLRHQGSPCDSVDSKNCRKLLGVPDHLIYLLRNLYASQETS